MLAQVHSAGIIGVDGYLVEVEVDISMGLPTEVVVGLPDSTVKESRDRIKAAIENSQMKHPQDRLTINLAPASIRKEGAYFDLSIAIGLLAASGQVKKEHLKEVLLIGELALDGRIRPAKGILSVALLCKKKGIKQLIVPFENAKEASVVDEIEVFGVESLSQTVKHLNKESLITPHHVDHSQLFTNSSDYLMDFSEVRGQFHVKRGMEVAAAGGHNLLMVGPPGSGKTMLASRLPSILPPMTLTEALETTKIYSITDGLKGSSALVTTRPFRAPHHTISNIGLVGGGSYPSPGEITLAHNGVLFLDELPEFRRDALEVLRQPMEERKVVITRAARSVSFPANFMLIVALNPCPCGYYSQRTRRCRCRPHQIHRYLSRISGPLMDRIDLHLNVPAVKATELRQKGEESEASEKIRERVLKAKKLQLKRFDTTPIFSNAAMSTREIKKFCTLTEESEKLFHQAIQQLEISARAYHKILKIARTIADLSTSPHIQYPHLAEAIQYRSLDRSFWRTGPS